MINSNPMREEVLCWYATKQENGPPGETQIPAGSFTQVTLVARMAVGEGTHLVHVVCLARSPGLHVQNSHNTIIATG